MDDVLDLTASSSMLGKPALNDLKSGLSTAPVLFAAEVIYSVDGWKDGRMNG